MSLSLLELLIAAKKRKIKNADDANLNQSCNIFDAGLHISVIDTRRDILNIYEKIYWRQCYNIYNAIYL